MIKGLILNRVLRGQVWLGRAILNVPLTGAALFQALEGHTRLGRKGVAAASVRTFHGVNRGHIFPSSG